jgi:PAS domain S-box-containing protein
MTRPEPPSQQSAALAASERELRTREERLRSLVASLPDVAWTVADDGRIIFISPNVEDIFGHSVEDIHKADPEAWQERVHPEGLQDVIQAFKALFSRDQPFDVEFRARHKDSRWIWVHPML